MSWASRVMRLRSRSCLMKFSSSEALAIQNASAPAMFFCFCNAPTTTKGAGLERGTKTASDVRTKGREGSV